MVAAKSFGSGLQVIGFVATPIWTQAVGSAEIHNNVSD